MSDYDIYKEMIFEFSTLNKLRGFLILVDDQKRLAGKYDLTESSLVANIQRRAFNN